MKFILVEDDDNKLEDVRKFIHSEYGNVTLREAASYQSALKLLIQEQFDVVLLDMTIPTFDKSDVHSAGQLRRLGGEDLLDQIYRRDIAGRIIIVTGYDMLGVGDSVRPLQKVVKELKERYPAMLAGAVFYSRAEERWKTELKALIDQVGVKQGGDAT